MPKGTESSIGLLSILMWIKEHYNQNVFIGLEISNLTIFHQIKRFKKFWKVKFLKNHKRDSNSYGLQILTHCAMLLHVHVGSNAWKENIYSVYLHYT